MQKAVPDATSFPYHGLCSLGTSLQSLQSSVTLGKAHNLSESQFPQPWNTDETSISKDSLDKAKIKHIEVLCELQIVTQCQLILILLLTLLLRPGRSSTKSPFTPGWVVETTGKDQYLWEKSHRILSSFSLRMVTACTRRCSHKHNPVILKHNGM